MLTADDNSIKFTMTAVRYVVTVIV